MADAPARSSLLDVLTVPVPRGDQESPLAARHAIDMHLGRPVEMDVRLDGRARRGLQTHGSFCVVPAGEVGRWWVERPARALILQLAPALVADAADAMGLPARAAALAPAIYVRDPQIEQLGRILQAERDDGDPGGRLFTDSIAAALAARLLGRQSGRAAPAPARRALPAWRLRAVIDYVEAHLDRELTLAELAGVAGFSVSHFKALFKQAIGVPVHRYVLERRVERARVLLLEARRGTTEIALEAGFSHASHMARCMRRVLGLSPAQLAARSRPTAGAPPRR
jgi:AraC family transcriptional regulator